MVAPNFKKATATEVDTSANPPPKYGAPDLKYALDVLDGQHATDRIQIQNIEGFNRMPMVQWIIKKRASDNTVIEAYNNRTGLLQTSSQAMSVLLQTLNDSADFKDGDTIWIKPDPIGFNYPNGYVGQLSAAGNVSAKVTKSMNIFGYGVKVRGGDDAGHRQASFLNQQGDGKTLRIFGLTVDTSLDGTTATRKIGTCIAGGEEGDDTATPPLAPVSPKLIQLEDFTLLNSFNRGVYFHSKGDGTGDTTVIVKNCYMDCGTINADTNDLLSVNCVKNLFVDNSTLISDETGTLAGHFVSVTNSFVSSFHPTVSPNPLGEGGSFSGQADEIYFGNCVFDAASIGLRTFITIHSGLQIAPCRRATVSGCSFIKRTAAPAWINVQPYDDTLDMGIVTIQNCRFPSGPAVKVTHSGSSSSTSFHSRVDSLIIENCYQSDIATGNDILVIEDKDVGFLSISNIHTGTSWPTTDSPVKMSALLYPTSVAYAKIEDTTDPQTGSSNFINLSNVANVAGNDTSIIFEMPLREGQGLQRNIGTAPGTATRTIKFISNFGTATFSGNGSTLTFNIVHNLVASPANGHIRVTAASTGARGNFWVTANATNITVNYASGEAPPSGTNNVVFYWSAAAA